MNYINIYFQILWQIGIRSYPGWELLHKELSTLAPETSHSNNGKTKTEQAFKSQNSFRTITRRAEDKGMVVNTDKTQLIVISDSLSYTPRYPAWRSYWSIGGKGQTIQRNR